MSEIDDPQQAKDDRQADGDQYVEAAEYQAADDLREQYFQHR